MLFDALQIVKRAKRTFKPVSFVAGPNERTPALGRGGKGGECTEGGLEHAFAQPVSLSESR
eukprot:4194143-Pyramimonas_sp.AAC.1